MWPRPGQWIQLGIATLADDRLVGDVGIHLSENGREAELGISCTRSQQRKGYARDAMTVVIDRLSSLGIHGITGVVDSRNTPCIRLMDSLGFRAARVSCTMFRGEPCVEVTYTLALFP